MPVPPRPPPGGNQLARSVEVWAGPLPGAPGQGEARLSVLTPAGIRFGQAALEALTQDDLAGPIMAVAQELLVALIDKTDRHQQSFGAGSRRCR